MKSTEIVIELSKRLQLSKEEISKLLGCTAEIIAENLTNNNAISLNNLGILEVKKKEERIIVHPSSGKRMLVPPKLTVGFKVSSILKEKIKTHEEHE